MRYIIWKCPKCKTIKFTRKSNITARAGKNRLQCNPCGLTVAIKNAAIKVFPDGKEREALAYYERKKRR